MTRSAGRIVEIELDGIRLAWLAVLGVALLGAAFWLGRLTAPSAPARSGQLRDEGPAAAGGTRAPIESVEQGKTVFDREGEGIEREPGRQVTGERTLGRFVLDCGASGSRSAAERLRTALEREGLPADVIRGPDGRYRTLCGPFSTRASAERAARRAGRVLGRSPRIIEDRPEEGR